MKILVTGSKGFVGKNLCSAFKGYDHIELIEFDIDSDSGCLNEALETVDFVIHLAGVNRPQSPDEFDTGNAGSIEHICKKLYHLKRTPQIILSSSIQADLDNPYGNSKRKAEMILNTFSQETGASCVVYRFKNLFGKWCRPNYNSVTATFCHNIANDLPIQISDPANEVDLTYIDDVVDALIKELDLQTPGFRFAEELPSFKISLGDLARMIQSFRDLRNTLFLPDFSKPFVRALYATYLSYLSEDNFGYALDIKSDERGSLAEFIKSPSFGQIFISHTEPGITRGNHYHHTKTEKFMVVAGEAMIRFRHINRSDIIEYQVRGEEYRVLDIPPGFTHSIENIGKEDLVTLFWASEVFNPEQPDTYFDLVLEGDKS